MTQPPTSEPPVIRNIVLDEDIWHPLDHRIGSGYCRSHNGGGMAAVRKHWEYWNDFKKHDDLAWFYRLTRCLVGRHHYQVWWQRDDSGQARKLPGRCQWCDQLQVTVHPIADQG